MTIPPKPRIWVPREIVLRMRFQAGITDRFHLRLFFQPARDFERVRAMSFHAQRQRFQTAQHKKTVERTGDCADRILQKRNLIAEFLVFADDDRRRQPDRNVRSNISSRNERRCRIRIRSAAESMAWQRCCRKRK